MKIKYLGNPDFPNDKRVRNISHLGLNVNVRPGDIFKAPDHIAKFISLQDNYELVEKAPKKKTEKKDGK